MRPATHPPPISPAGLMPRHRHRQTVGRRPLLLLLFSNHGLPPSPPARWVCIQGIHIGPAHVFVASPQRDTHGRHGWEGGGREERAPLPPGPNRPLRPPCVAHAHRKAKCVPAIASLSPFCRPDASAWQHGSRIAHRSPARCPPLHAAGRSSPVLGSNRTAWGRSTCTCTRLRTRAASSPCLCQRNPFPSDSRPTSPPLPSTWECALRGVSIVGCRLQANARVLGVVLLDAMRCAPRCCSVR